MTPFRFGLQATADDPAALLASARAAEAAGFDVFHTFDHIGTFASCLAPLAAGTAARAGRLRLSGCRGSGPAPPRCGPATWIPAGAAT